MDHVGRRDLADTSFDSIDRKILFNRGGTVLMFNGKGFEQLPPFRASQPKPDDSTAQQDTVAPVKGEGENGTNAAAPSGIFPALVRQQSRPWPQSRRSTVPSFHSGVIVVFVVELEGARGPSRESAELWIPSHPV